MIALPPPPPAMIQRATVPQLSDLFQMVAGELERPQDPIEDRIKAARAAVARKDILAWGKAVTPEKYRLEFCEEMHGYFVEIRGDEFTNTLAPRDHAKTTIKCHLIPLYQGLNEPETFDYYLNVQATAPKARAINLSIRHEIEYNEVIRAIYGDQMGLDKWTDEQFVLKNGVVYQALGAGQSVRGTQYLNRRPSYIIGDDLYDHEHINNPLATAKVNEWFWGDLYPARAETGRCSIHVQGTAINDSDLMKELEGKAGVKSKIFQAVKDWGKGEVLWPAFKTFDGWVKQRDTMPSVIFAREYLNERRDDSSSIVKKAWLEGWEFDPAKLEFDRHHQLVSVMLLVDPSIGAKVENDKTAMTVMIKSLYADAKAPDFWILELVNEHLSLDQRIQRMQKIVDAQPSARPMREARIEAVAGFKDFAAEARRRLRGVRVKEIDVVKDKISVLESKSWFFENKKVHVSSSIPKALRDEFAYQLTNNHPKNDDLRDSALLGLEAEKGWGWVG